MSATLDPTLQRFAELAEAYCAFIERFAEHPADAVLHEAHSRLPVLYAAALRLPDVCSDPADDGEAEHNEDDSEEIAVVATKPQPGAMTNDEWMELWRGLGKHLGDRKFYREMFAPYDFNEAEPVVGDLADDLADIYRDIRRGLGKWRLGDSAGAAWEWQFHFAAHWGEHATSALRALHALAFDHGLGPPPLGVTPDER